MEVSSRLCLHCDLCSCPELDVLANVAYCSKPGESDADRVVNTIVASQFLIKIEDTTESREVCNYQARVKITGEDNNPNFPSGEVTVLKPESEVVPAECETDEYEYTFIHDFKFEYEDNILNDQINFAKSINVQGCYSNIQIEVHIYAVIPESEDESEFECDDYAIMNRGCDEDDGSSETSSLAGDISDEVCICSWSSLDHDPDALVEGSPQGPCIIYGEVEGLGEDDITTCNVCDPCRVAPCFACGNLPISADSVHYLKPEGSLQLTMATNADTRDTYVDGWGIERVPIDADWNDSPMIVDVKAECYVIEDGEERIILEPEFTFAYSGRFEFSTKLRKSWYAENFYQNVPWQGLVDYETYKNTEIYVRYIPQESCECECLYGRKCSTSEDSDTTEYVLENPLNADLIETQTNYLNTEFVVGNCKPEITPPTQSESSDHPSEYEYEYTDSGELDYWCRLNSTITNYVRFTYGHNCEYSVTAKWWLQGKEIWSRQFTDNDLVNDLRHETYDKYALISSTETLPDLSKEDREYLNTHSNISIEQSYIEICVDEASSSTNDGYTTSAETFTYDECDDCCQKFQIINKCIANPGECIPCVVGDSVSCDFHVWSKLAGQDKHSVSLTTDVTGPLLATAEFDLSGHQSVTIAVADGETYSFNSSFYADGVDVDSVEICFNPITSDTPTTSVETD